MKIFKKKLKQSLKPNIIIYYSVSIEETSEIGIDIAKNYINNNSLILIEGELGSGKTTLIKEMLSFYGINKSEVTSPTFAIKNFYKSYEGMEINHYDLYLMSTLSIEYKSSIREDLQNGMVFIEWSNKYSFLKQKNTIVIKIALENEKRKIIMEVY